MTQASEVEAEVLSVLGRLEVPFDKIDIDPAFADTADFCARYGYEAEVCGNTIIVASKRGPSRFSACVVRASDRLDVNKTVKGLMGVSRASFASADQTVALTGMAIGGVTMFALPEGLPLYVDDKLLALDHVILGSGSRSSKIRVSPDVFHLILGARIIEGLSLRPRP